MKKLVPVLAIIAALILAGCAQKKISTPAPGTQEEMAPDTRAGEEKDALGGAKEETLKETEMARLEKAEPERPEMAELEKLSDIYFEFDSYEVKEEARPVLKELSEMLYKKGESLLIEGHADDRGTNEYNLALGDRRAAAVKKYLAALGVAVGNIEMVSYGEERPACTDQTEECWARNRRAHFVIQRAK